MSNVIIPVEASLSEDDLHALTDLYVRGTPANTVRAYERDLAYITAWKAAAFGADLCWPEDEPVAMRFILDHSRDLSDGDGEAAQVAQRLIASGFRRSLTCPAPSTLDRRIASWRSFHRMRNLPSPFDAPLIRQARSKARRAGAPGRAPKSANPITRDILEDMCAAAGPGLRGLRDRAVLLLGWASGGRRRSEIAGIRWEDLDLSDFDKDGLIWLHLKETKTTGREKTPRLVLKGRAARAVVAWIDAADIRDGPLFRKIEKSGHPGRRGLSPAGIGQIVKRCLQETGRTADFASAHGLRSGFLTQAALDGAPIQAAMRLSLHKSAAQAQAYYEDVDIAANPATDLLDRS